MGAQTGASRHRARRIASTIDGRRCVLLNVRCRVPIDQLIDVVERFPPTGIASSKMEPSESDFTSLNLPP
jgi:hypothetical protein